jgi:hypothetical protein
MTYLLGIITGIFIVHAANFIVDIIEQKTNEKNKNNHNN